MLKRASSLYVPLLLFVILVSGVLVLRHIDAGRPESQFSVSRAEKAVQSARAGMKACLSKIDISTITSHQELWRAIDSLNYKSVSILVFQGYELVAWTDHLLPVEGINPHYFKQNLVRLENGWYLTASRQEGDVLVVAFSLLKAEYLYQNRFLKNGFPANYGLDPTVLISRELTANSYSINDTDGEYLFSLIPGELKQKPSQASAMADIILLLAIAILWVFAFNIQKQFRGTRFANLVYVGVAALFSSLYYLLICVIGIRYFNQAELFSPHNFAVSNLLPSMGHFLLLSFLLFTLGLWFYKFVRFTLPIPENRIRLTGLYLLLIVMLGLASIYLVFVNRLFYTLALHSSGHLVLIRVTDLDLVILSRYLAVALLLLSFVFIAERLVLSFLIRIPRIHILIAAGTVMLINILVFRGLGVGQSDWCFLFFGATLLVLLYSTRNTVSGLSYTSYSWIAVIFSLYAGMVFMDMTIRKEESDRELLVENLSFQLLREEDPIAEIYLAGIEKQISNDVTLMRLMGQPELDPGVITNHLMKFYFYGYWRRFDIQIIPCWPSGDLLVEQTGEVSNCYEYFFGLIEHYGYPLEGSAHFYFMDDDDGQSSYFGVFRFFPDDDARETTLFIELHFKPFFEGLGYPELLVSDRDLAKMRLLEEYSYAKYLDGRLVKRSGEFMYKAQVDPYFPVPYSKVFLKEGNYSHLVYQPSPNATILLSRKDFTVTDVLMAFSLFFLFFFLLTGIVILLLQWQSKGFSFRISIQKRIQTVFVAVMVLMLIVVATGTVYYTVKQYRQKHLELLESKVQSIMLELEYKVGLDGPETSSPGDYLNYQLQMISTVFYCDINLYGVDGTLIGTSRPELFRSGLAGTQMNPKAYYNLAYTEAVSHLEEEQIGSMKYISFYVPLLDSNNRLSGFLNLPYFVGNNDLRSEISSVIVTIVNFYLLFSFLVILIAVFLSRQITRPLLLLQTKISQIKLDRLNEKIDYKGQDEIGELVAEYNRMVDELTISAGKLARTERELAWREMARQIAHEIKNPLTPMKLSIQYLQRAWKDNVVDFDAYLKKVTDTLIEQINSLSSIASEFSRFAQMPPEKSEVINLIEKIENSRTLFGDTGSVPVVLVNMAGDIVKVRADGEQLLGIFNNLIKNAIQSIPDNREGRIEIEVSRDDEKVVVAIKDNGKGVPDEIRTKLFEPSFTTKTGGMGLGLAISKRAVENAGGRIWFTSEENTGSVFYVELPVISDSK